MDKTTKTEAMIEKADEIVKSHEERETLGARCRRKADELKEVPGIKSRIGYFVNNGIATVCEHPVLTGVIVLTIAGAAGAGFCVGKGMTALESNCDSDVDSDEDEEDEELEYLENLEESESESES